MSSAWQKYPKKDKLLQQTKPRNNRQYEAQLKRYHRLEEMQKLAQDKRKRIMDVFNLSNLVRGVKPIKNRNKWSK